MSPNVAQLSVLHFSTFPELPLTILQSECSKILSTPVLGGGLEGKGLWGRMDTGTWMTESPWLFTSNYHNTVVKLYRNTKFKKLI